MGVAQRLGRADPLQDDVVDLDPELAVCIATALADDVGLEQTITDRPDELDQQAYPDPIANMDLGVPSLGGPLRQLVGAIWAELELRLRGGDLDEARAHRHRRVDRDREVLPGAERRLVALDEDRGVEVS